MAYLHLMEMARIAEQLQKWVNERDGLSAVPMVCVAWSPDSSAAITIGDVTVYCSENSPELSFDACRAEFLTDLLEHMPFWREAKEFGIGEYGPEKMDEWYAPEVLPPPADT